MTDIKQNQQTTEKSKVYIIIPPSPRPKWKNIACWEKVENAIFFYRLEKIVQPPLPPPPQKKKFSSPESTPVQSLNLMSKPFNLKYSILYFLLTQSRSRSGPGQINCALFAKGNQKLLNISFGTALIRIHSGNLLNHIILVCEIN